MRGSVTALDEWHGVPAAARLVDGRLDDVLVDPPADTPRLDAIYLAKAGRPVKGMGGLFVKLPDGATGFLTGKDPVKPGKPALVQVSGYAEPGKAVPLRSALLFKGRNAILTPGAPGVNISRRIRGEATRQRLLAAVAAVDLDGHGAILRSNAIGAEPEAIAEELRILTRLGVRILSEEREGEPALLLDGPDAHDIALRDWPISDVLDDRPEAFARHGIDDLVTEISRPLAEFQGGTTAWIEPTRALVAVDVNTAGDMSASAGLKANIALARDLPRQLRCRGLGGQITIDFAPMAKRDRRQIEQALRTAFRADPTETALVGWTPLGHFELQRKRDRLPIV